MAFFYRHIIEMQQRQIGINGPEYVLEDAREKIRKPLNEYAFFKKYPIIFKDSLSQKNNFNSANVYQIPLNQIFVNKDLFQNRKADYSIRSVNKIITAVENGTFNFNVLDPVLLWKAPDDKLYILSGHSRTKAFQILSNRNEIYKGKNFNTIPAKIIETDIKTAQKIALESNTLSTKETILERADRYRSMREIEQIPAKEVQQIAKENEDKNANTIIRLSYLNPNGLCYKAIEALETSDSSSRSIMEQIGTFLGQVRMRFSELTDSHENELYLWLKNGAFPKKVPDIRTFETIVYNIISRRKMFGEWDSNEPLNINNVQKTTFYDTESERLISEINAQKKHIENRRKDLLSRGGTAQQVSKILEKEMIHLNNLTKEYQKLIQNRSKIREESNKQMSLFGISGLKKNNLNGIFN